MKQNLCHLLHSACLAQPSALVYVQQVLTTIGTHTQLPILIQLPFLAQYVGAHAPAKLAVRAYGPHVACGYQISVTKHMKRRTTDIYVCVYNYKIVIELTSVELAHNGPNYSWGSRLR